MTRNYYGMDVPIIRQAAQEHNVELIAIDGLALGFITDKRLNGFWDGRADYLWLVKDAPDERESVRRLDVVIRQRMAELYNAQEEVLIEQSSVQDKEGDYKCHRSLQETKTEELKLPVTSWMA